MTDAQAKTVSLQICLQWKHGNWKPLSWAGCFTPAIDFPVGALAVMLSQQSTAAERKRLHHIANLHDRAEAHVHYLLRAIHSPTVVKGNGRVSPNKKRPEATISRRVRDRSSRAKVHAHHASGRDPNL